MSLNADTEPQISLVSNDPEQHDEMAVSLIVINIVGILLGYAITIIVARQLSTSDFEQYIGAIATALLLASIGEAGFGKYAMRIIPLYAARDRSALLSGYVRYAMAGTILLSAVLAVSVGAIEVWFRSGLSERSMMWAICFIPIIAATGVAVDLLMAFRLAKSAMLISRILIPSVTLIAIGLAANLPEFTPTAALLSFFSGSCIGLIVTAQIYRSYRPKRETAEAASFRMRDWSRGSLAFMAFYFLLSLMFRSTLAFAHHLPHDPNELALLAPAFETGCLVFLLSKSTDKYYHPQISLFVDSSSWTDWPELQRRRSGVIALGIAVFLFVVFVFGKHILAMYGSQFTDGYVALCIVAVGSSTATVFSLSPTFLLFSGAKQQLVVLLCVHVLLLAATTAIAFPTYGATGAASAYAVSISSFAFTSNWASNRRFRALRRVGELS